MSDGGIVSTEVDGFRIDTNASESEETLREEVKGRSDKGLSRAGKELGKAGARAAAEKRATEPSEKPEGQEKAEAKPAEEPEKAVREPKEAEKQPEEAKGKAEPVPEEKAEPDKAEEPEKPEQKDKKGDPRHDPRARMLEATRQAAELKRQLAERERELQEIRSRAQQPPQETQKPQRDPDTKPDPAEFNDYEEYLDARDEYNRRQWERQTEVRQHASAVDHAITTQIQKVQEKLRPIVDKLSPEILEMQTELQAIGSGVQPNGSHWLANEFFFNTERAPALMLYLSEHEDERQRIAALKTPREVIREVAKIEARLEAANTGDSPKREEDVSRAAPPVKPVTGKPYVSEPDSYREGMSLDEYAPVWSKTQRR